MLIGSSTVDQSNVFFACPFVKGSLRPLVEYTIEPPPLFSLECSIFGLRASQIKLIPVNSAPTPPISSASPQ